MSDETLISDFLARAEARLDEGCEPDLETVCAAAPHLLPEIRDRFRKLRAIRRLTDPAPAPCPTLPIHGLASRHGYQIVREVGGGNMGVVYEARDPHGRAVALKTLSRPDPARLAYLKQEFEALAGIRHENLVAIYGQVSDGDTWFYVMEFVPGRHFLEHVGDRPAALRPALVQLARGLHTLHRAGKVHRDIKSSNVLVARDGRVKLLDYGLVAELDDSQAYAQWGLAGTVGYMSPEQCGTRPLTPASDWYGFGALLYEALTGRLPFAGTFLEVLQRKQAEEPARPATIAPNVPDDLNQLCVELLRIDPAARPTGEEVLRRLGGAGPTPEPPVEDILLGRDGHLAALRAAAGHVRRTGVPVLVELHGPSGVGKTALARRFLREVQAAGEAVVLAGQCYEQSAVPYKALDSLIGGLCRYLRKLPREKADALLPVHLGELARLFPVLGRLEAVVEAPPVRADDPHEVRRRAYQALRDLLCRMTRRGPLVLFVDDLQWGDAESAALGAAIVRPPDAPPILFLAGYRRGDGAASPFIRALHKAEIDRREVPVDPLAEGEARDLAAALLGPGRADQAAVIAREAAGSPLLVHELVRFFRTGGAADRLTLDTVLRARAARLGDDPRRLLEAVAVAAGPIDPDTAGRAADLPPERQPEALDQLLTNKFVRAVVAGEGRRVEAYHDRIREAVAGGLAPDATADYHRRLAEAHQAAGDAGPELLAFHFARAGDAVRAVPFHARAAEQAAAVLAFDRAAGHYEQALAGLPAGDPRHRGWLLARAGALAGAGRGREAAVAFAAAADLSSGTDALFCRQRAAEQLTRSGRFDEGMAALVAVLRGVGIEMPQTPAALWRSVLWLRLWSWLRGFRVRERPAADVPPEDQLRIEVFRWAAGVVRMVDLLRGIWFHYRGLRLSLRVGEPYALAQALARETTIGLPMRGQTPDRIERLSGLAREVAGRVADPAQRAEAEAVVQLYRAIAYYLIGDFRRALTEAEAADAALGRCAGVSAAYQRATVRMFETSALLYLGELTRCRALFDAEYHRQLDRGNLPGVVVLPLAAGAHHLELAADRPAAARRMIAQAIGRWDQDGFHLLRLYAWWAELDVLLYEGRTGEAWAHCEVPWRMVNRRSLLTIDLAVLLASSARARCAVARAADLRGAGDRARVAALLREAARRSGRMERLRGLPIASPFAALIRAAIAHQSGRGPTAVDHLGRAESAFADAGLAVHAAAARRQRGLLLGDGALVSAADAELTARGVQSPARYAGMLAPGFPAAGDAAAERPG